MTISDSLYYDGGTVAIHHGDCLSVMSQMSANSVDSIVTDPPYGLSFMGKDWDHGVPGEVFWQEALRVAKPGAHLLAFGGTRTYHRLAVAIEDAGWEIRDCLMWLYGSGFPKSLNIGDGYGTALKPGYEPIIMARKPLTGTVATNVQQWGTGGINVDGCRIEGIKDVPASPRVVHRDGRIYHPSNEDPTTPGWNPNVGRWPANLLLDEEAAVTLDIQTGILNSGKDNKRRQNHDTTAMAGRLGMLDREEVSYGDSGGASRFFYVAKASRSEREQGLEYLPKLSPGQLTDRQDGAAGTAHPRAGAGRDTGNHNGRANNHPTVKPIALMRWLVRLVTPPGGFVLDPFCGSGSTLIAAKSEGFHSVGIDTEADYLNISIGRVTGWEG